MWSLAPLATETAVHRLRLAGVWLEPLELQHKIGVRIERNPITLYGSSVCAVVVVARLMLIISNSEISAKEGTIVAVVGIAVVVVDPDNINSSVVLIRGVGVLEAPLLISDHAARVIVIVHAEEIYQRAIFDGRIVNLGANIEVIILGIQYLNYCGALIGGVDEDGSCSCQETARQQECE